MTRPTNGAPDQLHLVTWNTKVGRRPGAIAFTLLDHFRSNGYPDVAILLEAGRYTQALRDTLGTRYRVLVDRRIPMPRWRTITLRISWIGPKAFKRHPGRVFPVVDLGKGTTGAKWRIVGIHRTPGGPTGGLLTRGKNKPSWNAEHRALAKLAHRKGSLRRALVLAGDQNCQVSDRHPMSVGGLAFEIDARIVRTGAKVDWALVRGCNGTGHRGSNLGSDHPLITYNLRANKRSK
jgi:hypothetical protein